jgi:hypothetical protein
MDQAGKADILWQNPEPTEKRKKAVLQKRKNQAKDADSRKKTLSLPVEITLGYAPLPPCTPTEIEC